MGKIKVLHIGHSAKWRGGENQVRLLIERMNELDLGVEHHLAFPQKAIIFERLQKQVNGYIQLPSNKPMDPRSVFQIARYCKHNNIQIIHAHSGNSHTVGFLVKKLVPSLKFIVHRRVDNHIRKKLTSRKKYLTKEVDQFIGISNAIVSILKNYGVDEKKITFIPSSVDDKPYRTLDKGNAKLKLTTKYGLDKNKPLIGFISALENQKNPELFIEILNELNTNGKNYGAIIAGSGRKSEKIALLIEKYNLSKNVKMLGFVENVNEIFSALDIFVLPSRNEGLGTVLLEASLAKAALVAADVGGISEVVIENKTGRLIESTQLKEFESAISSLIDNDAEKNKLINNAYEHVNSMFSLNKMAENTYKVYKKVM